MGIPETTHFSTHFSVLRFLGLQVDYISRMVTKKNGKWKKKSIFDQILNPKKTATPLQKMKKFVKK